MKIFQYKIPTRTVVVAKSNVELIQIRADLGTVDAVSQRMVDKLDTNTDGHFV